LVISFLTEAGCHDHMHLPDLIKVQAKTTNSRAAIFRFT
jgi:hypothetical protein